MQTVLKFFLFLSFSFSLESWAQSAKGTFVLVQGDVKIFYAKPKRSKKYKKAHYLGKLYSYQKAKIGRKISAGDIVHSGPKGKVKIVYSNGDHFIVGPGSSIVFPAPESDKVSAKTKKLAPTLNLIYGRVRVVISKGNGFRHLKVKTRSTVAGVRGTDFYVKSDGVSSNVSVLRGSVEIQPKFQLSNKANTSVIKSGFSAHVSATAKTPTKAAVTYKTPKSELKTIQKASTIKVQKVNLSEQVKKETEALEKAAVAAVLNDIKIEEPELYEQLKNKEHVSTQELNTVVVSKRQEQAPNDLRLPASEEVYDRYFEVE